MPYHIEFLLSAKRALARLDKPVQRRIVGEIETLADDPRRAGTEPLKGGEGQWRLRVGDWRVIYTIEDARLIVLVVVIGHRGDIYR